MHTADRLYNKIQDNRTANEVVYNKIQDKRTANEVYDPWKNAPSQNVPDVSSRNGDRSQTRKAQDPKMVGHGDEMIFDHFTFARDL